MATFYKHLHNFTEQDMQELEDIAETQVNRASDRPMMTETHLAALWREGYQYAFMRVSSRKKGWEQFLETMKMDTPSTDEGV